MSLAIVTALCLTAGPLSPRETAVIERENEKAQAEVAAKYGNRKLTEMTTDERRSMMKDQADAERKVLEKHNVSANDWAKASEYVSRKDMAERKAIKKELEEKEKADAEAAKKGQPKEIEVQRGISEDNPVTLDERPPEDGVIPVEKSIPLDAANDMREAEGGGASSAGTGGGDEEAPRPAAKGGKSKGGKKR